ncbi:AraC family transcriptional regulator [Jeotgalibacillus proteolyticus]|uniref:AraC family transcriptional regulator n=1 Tax=Jeotgalibacillus proteolyticus TaxID=2082395 RepID=A0A2S5G7X3_9BACL|nr:AraC family transcriptional regulator [Jeotgalibacillus proteolyticus]PPA69086.1 AraC family transcriptional regulator [Jeotgalibacillus proteolyticus]
MNWIQSLQASIDYIEDHLLEDIEITNVAKQAMVSPFHFQRMFGLLTGMPVGEYIRRRRLTLAAHELVKEDVKIIDAALKFGYNTPESFSKAFRKQHGLSPREAKSGKGKLHYYHRLVIQVTLRGETPMKVEVIEKGSVQVVGIRQEVSCADGENSREIPKIWGRVNQDGTADSLASINNGEIKGVLGICVDKSKDKPDTIDYWVAAAHEGDRPERFETMELPASKWAVFEVRGAMPHAIQTMWNRIYTEWFPASNYKHAGTPDLEVYSGGDPMSEEYISEIWIPVK